jgi:Zn-dependent peptidase ImmA (M78 family)
MVEILALISPPYLIHSFIELIDDINNFAVTSKNAFKNVEYEANLFAVSLLFNECDFNMKFLNMSNYLLKQVHDYNIVVVE